MKARFQPLLALLIILLHGCTPTDRGLPASGADANVQPSTTEGDSLAATAVVEQFHAALVAADSTTAADMLAANAVILEAGGLETKEQYLSHHFHSDAAFLGATASKILKRHFQQAGDVAWVSSTSRIHGSYRERDVDMNAAELMILQRTPDGWRVAAIHWSSRSRGT